MVSIIPTTRGEAKSIGVVIPELDGKLDGMALRVPVSSNGSLADMVLILKKDVTKEELNNALKESSQTDLKGIMTYTEDPIVSIGYYRSPASLLLMT
jgi:glyceraldehyde 3-phosphate dehydrogenase